MIRKYLPGFCFLNPTTILDELYTVDLRIASVNVNTVTTRLRALWTPELAQDVSAFHNIDAEAELSGILNEEIMDEIYREMARDLNDNQRFYNQNGLRGALNRWDQIQNNFLMNNNTPDFNLLPIATRVSSQTIGLNLTILRSNGAPIPLENHILPIETFLPDEEGWFTKGVFESLFIKMNMKSFDFIPYYLKNRRLRRRRL